jgi:hypothetical protein
VKTSWRRPLGEVSCEGHEVLERRSMDKGPRQRPVGRGPLTEILGRRPQTKVRAEGPRTKV